MNDNPCPKCSNPIDAQYLYSSFQEAISDGLFDDTFEIKCPSCKAPIKIEVITIPIFSIIHQP